MRYSIIGNKCVHIPFIDDGVPEMSYVPDFSSENKVIKETGLTSDIEILRRHPALESVLPQVSEFEDNPPRLSYGQTDEQMFDSMIPRGLELSEIEDYVSEQEKLAVEQMKKSKKG